LAEIEGGIVVAFITAPKGKGREIGRKLVEARVAACINVSSVSSIYWWKGKIEEDEEELLIVKTTAGKVEELVKKVRQIHPYEVPEIIILPVVACLAPYCQWVRSETRSS
jgi:periplasmic divalent cation tolerance protein